MKLPGFKFLAKTNSALLLALLLGFPLLFIGGPTYTSSVLYKHAWNLGHVGFFCVFATWSCQSLNRNGACSNKKALLLLSLALLMGGILIEWIQYGINRNPDWHDIWRNMLGGWLGWAICQKRTTRIAVWTSALVLGVLVEVAQVGIAVLEDRNIQRQLPLIADFESSRELGRWEGNVSLAQVEGMSGKSCLKIQLSTSTFSGTGSYQIPHDWRSYRYLRFQVFNPDSSSVRLHTRINDRVHYPLGKDYYDRFNKVTTIYPGWNFIEIDLNDVRFSPTAREMDMDDVFWLGIFTKNLPQPRVIFLDNFRLEITRSPLS